MSRLITDDMVSAALHYLATSSRDSAAARGMRVRSEFARRRVRSRLTMESREKTAAGREADAEMHPDYEAACEREASAAESEEFHRCERNKANSILEAWRTEQATQRAGSHFR